ncbi:MAG: GYF domain-containing protein [Muribaculaceae bacterium]|nr:GYF domain-containing protein [Muribaculaceae bacterium]
MQYYIIVNGSQLGPYSKEELSLQGITAETLVWHEGLPEWVKANAVPELYDLIAETNFGSAPKEYTSQPPVNPPYTANPQGYPQFNPYAQPMPFRQAAYPIPHTNWMPWAIIVTILSSCSCIGLILGILAIVNASKANTFYDNGQKAEGDSANSTARTLTIINIVLLVLGVIGYIIYFCIAAATIFPYME